LNIVDRKEWLYSSDNIKGSEEDNMDVDIDSAQYFVEDSNDVVE